MCELIDKIFSDSLVFLTLLIALATIGYMVFTVFMWLTMKHSLKLSRNIFESTHRPFIGVSEIKLHFTDAGLLNPSITYENFGSLPAKQIILELKCSCNSEIVSEKKIELPNLFPSNDNFWANVIQSDFLKDNIGSPDSFECTILLNYSGVTSDIFTTKEVFKYDYDNDSFLQTESKWD